METSEFWQKEAHRFDAASRAMTLRMRTEISLGVTALGSVVALVVVNEIFELLLAVPFLAIAIWGLALSSIQESFLLDAHLMHAESMVSNALVREGQRPFPLWADNGGNLIRFGLTQKIMTISWVTASVVVVGSCIYFLMKEEGPGAVLALMCLEVGFFIVAGILGARSADRAGSQLFERFRSELLVSEEAEGLRDERESNAGNNPLRR